MLFVTNILIDKQILCEEWGERVLSESEIIRFIQEDESSDKKRFAKVGQKYYEGEHDIRNYRLFYYNADGQLVEDKTRSNIKISHPFFTELVDQEVQYMLSGKGAISLKSDIPELQNELNEYFNENEDFTSELYEVLTGAITKGFEYMYAYKNVEDKLSFQCADSLGVVEVRAKDTEDGCDYVIYWYVDKIAKDNKKIKINPSLGQRPNLFLCSKKKTGNWKMMKVKKSTMFYICFIQKGYIM